MRGIIRPCASVVPVLRHLAIPEATNDHTVLVTELNQQQLAFAIDSVERIHRLSWEKVLSLPPLAEFAKSPVTAIANIDGKLVLMLDLESIHAKISDQYHDATAVPNPTEIPRSARRVLVAEDSPTVRNAVRETLKASGYENVRMFENGLLAWNFIEEAARQGGSWQAAGDFLVTDIEMPQMDGLHLTKKIKDTPTLSGLPILLYSSIVTPDNQKKGKAVGADAQIAKTELHRIVEWADKLAGPPTARVGTAPATPTIAPAPIAPEPSAIVAAVSAREPNPSPAAVVARVVPPPSPQPPFVAPSPSAIAAAAPALRSESTPEPTDRMLWRSFCEEMWDRVQALHDGVEEQGKNDPVEIATGLYRVVHSIKSAASVIPLPEVVAAAHGLEDRLGRARAKQADVPWDWVGEFADWLTKLMWANDATEFLATNRAPTGVASS